ncbi:MAG: molecular chaperone [Gammaproteobacteria bacterium]|nr:molecular chaperone [Gammaproteobacteria bacterium]
MYAGFDYGTSYCSIGLWRDGGATLVPLEEGSSLIASTLYAPKLQLELEHRDDSVLDMSAQSFAALRFGQQALDAYLTDPTEGYFVKSPKSFLGAPGLNEDVKNRFILVVAAMMGNVKRYADEFAGEEITRVVIGRPVNFQGTGGDAENQQALSMLVAAAHEAGFVEVSFLFEPMAAAMEYESTIDEEQKVLVVDVGGGTTDCSFVCVGPEHRGSKNREADVLGHSGERLGGNDYDQMLALQSVMPSLGFGDELVTGLPIPNTYYVDAVSTNDVNAQQRFYSTSTAKRLDVFVRDGCYPERVERLRTLRNKRSTYRLLREVELAKIALSEELSADVDLDFLEELYSQRCTREQLKQGSERLLQRLQGLINEVRNQAGVDPDVVYLTGGMARSAVVRAHLDTVLGGIEYLDSDHFASVTQGLTIWARELYD